MKKLLDKIFLGLLTALGFSTAGCSDNATKYTPTEYGTPTAMYDIKGKVTDASQPGVGIEGIRMIFGLPDAWARFLDDTVYTAADGTYQYNGVRPSIPPGLDVWLKDVDGDANGNFRADTVQLPLSGGEWKQISGNSPGSYVYKYTETGVDFVLEPGSDPEPPAPETPTGE